MEVKMIDISKIKSFPIDTRYIRLTAFIEDLARDIKKNGIINPLLLLPGNDGYICLDGHYRLEAARRAGLKEVPAVVLEKDDLIRNYIKAIKVNVMRKRYNALDIAHIAIILHNRFGMLYKDIADRLGISRMHLHRCLYVYNHALEEEKIAYLKGKISFRQLYKMVKERENEGKNVYICPCCMKKVTPEDCVIVRMHKKCYEELLKKHKR